MRSTSCGFETAPNGTGAELLILTGPTLVVDIGFDPDYLAAGMVGAPSLAMKDVHALVDTGATMSCIDSQLAIALGLPIVDQASVAGIGGAKVVNMHLAQIHVPSLQQTAYGSFAGVDLIAGGQSHSALIGRSFLRSFVMIYNGLTGSVQIFDAPPPDAPQLPFTD